MRKFWFAYMAKALVVFPGGFGTLDEMFELLTLAQTEKLEKQIQIILYGSEYWDPILQLRADGGVGRHRPRPIRLSSSAPTRRRRPSSCCRAHLTTHHLEAPEPETKRVQAAAAGEDAPLANGFQLSVVGSR